MSKKPANPLLGNVLSVNVADPLAIRCSEFVAPFIANTEGLEIEGKVGFLRARKGTNAFILPHATSAVALDPSAYDAPWRFESNVPEDRFTHLQTNVFNGRVNNFRATKQGMNIEYSKRRIRDTFHNVAGERVRVSRDPDTGALIECIIKKKPQNPHLDIYVPNSPLMFRVSVNKEVPVPVPTEPAVEVREKERRSYMTGMWSIDFTTVTAYSTASPQDKGISREIEVEVMAKHLPVLKKAMEQVARGNSGDFTDIMSSLLDTLRTIIYCSRPNAPPLPSCIVPAAGARHPATHSGQASSSASSGTEHTHAPAKTPAPASSDGEALAKRPAPAPGSGAGDQGQDVQLGKPAGGSSV